MVTPGKANALKNLNSILSEAAINERPNKLYKDRKKLYKKGKTI